MGAIPALPAVPWWLEEMAYQFLLQPGKEMICRMNGCLAKPVNGSPEIYVVVTIRHVNHKEPKFHNPVHPIGKRITLEISVVITHQGTPGMFVL